LGGIAILLGTRPEIIKLSPIIRHCKEKNLLYRIIHSNQHYDFSLDKIFFTELGLPKPKHELKVGSGTHAETTSKCMIRLEKVLLKEKPSLLMIQGDTNTVLAGALVAAKIQVPIAHVESGLRSYDRTMPEEINRIIVNRCFVQLLEGKPKILSKQDVHAVFQMNGVGRGDKKKAAGRQHPFDLGEIYSRICSHMFNHFRQYDQIKHAGFKWKPASFNIENCYIVSFHLFMP